MTDNSVQLLPAEPKHVVGIANLHATHMNGKLTNLGRPLLERFYTRLVESAAASVSVVESDAGLVGYVVVCLDEQQVMQECLLANKLDLLKHSKISGLLKAVTASFLSTGSAEIGPTLMYIVVDEQARGGSASMSLMKAAERYFAEAACSAFRLRVSANNPRGINYYFKHGFRAVDFEPRHAQILLEKPIEEARD